ncbi:hypothetical protein I601_0551 [Nocardioides dokdonensis FR1436]|uniref:FHA domain-containing protein n=1 Tax=Nocardioides dokdonensis FR1436 TaxID=1300347 RepID=A0A1A9GHB8_9ACTN|nr:FHA domain-containing protein [Nocardioides dokdonensis]ANH37003.1 hypothetical protein I601_0551 [Nocardioides dokdonensis FR1436]
MSTQVSADLRFSLEREGRSDLHGHLSGVGNRLTLDVDDPGAFAGAGDAPVIRQVAAELAARDIVLRVVRGETHLVTLGAVRAPWWQRRLTRSRRIRLGSLRGAWTSARSRAAGRGPVLPGLDLSPPATLWPPFPTMHPQGRRRVTTTHDPAGGGNPRLVLVREQVWGGERQPVFWLAERQSIGSDASCDIVLPGLEPVHAVMTHDERDEYVVHPVAGLSRVHGAPVVEPVLMRTGSRLDLGGHHLVFTREEHADHGRPHGGRVGGELGHQAPQPPRPQAPRAPVAQVALEQL